MSSGSTEAHDPRHFPELLRALAQHVRHEPEQGHKRPEKHQEKQAVPKYTGHGTPQAEKLVHRQVDLQPVLRREEVVGREDVDTASALRNSSSSHTYSSNSHTATANVAVAVAVAVAVGHTTTYSTNTAAASGCVLAAQLRR